MPQNKSTQAPQSDKPVSVRTIALIVTTMVAAFAAGGWLIYDSARVPSIAESVPSAAQRKSPHAASDHSISLICEGTVATPINGFDAPAKVVSQTFVGGIDAKDKTGWYQGTLALSETRKGTVITDGNVHTVSRPALFERYGAMITGEQFTLDRTTGAFEQSVTLNDKRRFVLIKAQCGRLIKPPF